MLSVVEAHKSTMLNHSNTVNKQVEGQFAQDAKILFVPTGAGATGMMQIEEFIKTASKQAYIIESEKVLLYIFIRYICTTRNKTEAFKKKQMDR